MHRRSCSTCCGSRRTHPEPQSSRSWWTIWGQQLPAGNIGALRSTSTTMTLMSPHPFPAPAGDASPRRFVSVWVDCYDRRSSIEDVLRSGGPCGWRDTRCSSPSTPTTAAAGGPAHVTGPTACGHRGSSRWRPWEQPPGTDFEEWLTVLAHPAVSPMSEAVQPRCRYVRNLVVGARLRAGAPPWRRDRRRGVAQCRACDRSHALLLRRRRAREVMSARTSLRCSIT